MIVAVVDDQRRGRHGARKRGDVQLLEAEPEAVLQILLHHVPDPMGNAQMLGEGVGEYDYIGRRGQENHALSQQAV
jgi:hypothetical protein